MKTYVIDRNGTWGIETRTHKPSNYIGMAIKDELTGEYEDARWLQLEMIDDGQGNMVETLTVDQAKKAQIQDQEQQDKQLAEQDKKNKEDKKKAIDQKIKQMKPEQINNINDIREAIKDILEWINN